MLAGSSAHGQLDTSGRVRMSRPLESRTTVSSTVTFALGAGARFAGVGGRPEPDEEGGRPELVVPRGGSANGDLAPELDGGRPDGGLPPDPVGVDFALEPDGGRPDGGLAPAPVGVRLTPTTRPFFEPALALAAGRLLCAAAGLGTGGGVSPACSRRAWLSQRWAWLR